MVDKEYIIREFKIVMDDWSQYYTERQSEDIAKLVSIMEFGKAYKVTDPEIVKEHLPVDRLWKGYADEELSTLYQKPRPTSKLFFPLSAKTLGDYGAISGVDMYSYSEGDGWILRGDSKIFLLYFGKDKTPPSRMVYSDDEGTKTIVFSQKKLEELAKDYSKVIQKEIYSQKRSPLMSAPQIIDLKKIPERDDGIELSYYDDKLITEKFIGLEPVIKGIPY